MTTTGIGYVPANDPDPETSTVELLPGDAEMLARFDAACERGERSAWWFRQVATPHQRQVIADHEAKRERGEAR